MPSTIVDAEEALQEIIYTNMTDYHIETVKSSIDEAYTNAFDLYSDNPKFAVTEFLGGNSDRDIRAFGKTAPWNHNLRIEFHIPVLGDDEDALATVEASARADYQEFLSNIAGNSTYRCLGNNRSFHVVSISRFLGVDMMNQRFLMFRVECEIKELLDS